MTYTYVICNRFCTDLVKFLSAYRNYHSNLSESTFSIVAKVEGCCDNPPPPAPNSFINYGEGELVEKLPKYAWQIFLTKTTTKSTAKDEADSNWWHVACVLMVTLQLLSFNLL